MLRCRGSNGPWLGSGEVSGSHRKLRVAGMAKEGVGGRVVRGVQEELRKVVVKNIVE